MISKMELPIFKIDGSKGEECVKVSSEIFEKKPNDYAIYYSVISQMTNSRQGTHSTKNRSMTRGGGRKPYKQKGTGRARAGSIRSPLWKGGGRVFGPKPLDYVFKLPKKVKRLARISALAYKLKEGEIIVVEDFDFEKPQTKYFFNILKSLEIDNKETLFVTEKKSDNILKSCRNIPNITIRLVDTLSTYDILNCEKFLIQESALKKLNACFKNEQIDKSNS